MKKTRLVALGLVTALVVGLFGCSDKTSTGTSEESKVSKTSETSKSTESTVQEAPTVITIGMQQNDGVSSYSDNYLTKAVEEKFNVEIEWYMLPSAAGDAVTKMNLMATAAGSEDMPDILIGESTFSDSFVTPIAAAGVFKAIDDYIADPEKTPYFNALDDELKESMLQTMTFSDGHIYGFADYSVNLSKTNIERMFINNAWLDKLELETPTTTEELKNVLIAFRDGDPNGNNVQDEVGVYGRRQGYGQDIIPVLMNSFVSWNNGKMNGGLAVDQETGLTVVAPWVTDEWKDGIKYLNELYEEDVLVASLFTDDETIYKSTLNQNPSIVGLTGAYSNVYFTEEAIRDQYRMIAPLEGPDGVAWSACRSDSYNVEAVFTCSGELLDLCVTIMDAFYDMSSPDSLGWISALGEYGVDWTDDPEICAKTSNAYVEAGVSSGIEVVRLVNLTASPMNKHWRDRAPGVPNKLPVMDYYMGDYIDGVGYDTEVYDVNREYLALYATKMPKTLPVLTFTTEETDALGDIRSNIVNLVNTFLAECTVGVKDVEKEWDAYVAEIESMGLDKWLEIAQGAYDRRLGK